LKSSPASEWGVSIESRNQMSEFFTRNISEADPLISEAIDDEVRRLADGPEIIRSGNRLFQRRLQVYI
jgi:hypothetical protein